MPGTYGIDYIYPSESNLDYFKSKGITLIRLPFKWERLQHCLNCDLDQTELARIDSVVSAASARGMQVILDPHNYARYHGNLIGSSQVPNSAFADFWERLAGHFNGKSGIWAYALMNEPHDTNGLWPAAAQAGVDGIRASDSQRLILVPGDGWSGAWTWNQHSANLSVNDPANNYMYEAHQYFDGNGSGTYTKSYDADGAYPEIGVDRVRPFVEWLQARGAKGFIGEFGVPNDDPRWLDVMDNFLAYLQQNGISSTYWAGGPWWGSYPLSIEPHNGQDAPQMAIIEQYANGTASPPPANPTPPPGDGPTACGDNSFQASYFNGIDLSGDPVLERCETTVDHDWRGGSPDPSVATNRFSARWVGSFDFQSGAHTFTVRADDGIRLTVDGNLLINGWKDQSATTYTATTQLSSGLHEVEVEYYENGGDAVAQVSWAASGSGPDPAPPADNTPPSASASANVTSGDAPLTVSFSASGSHDPDGDALNYSWSFGDGSSGASGLNATHTYQAPGSYTATLHVDDGNGGSDSDTLTITVSEPPVTSPGACPEGQFAVEYFGNTALSGNPVTTRCEGQIDYKWGKNTPMAGVPSDRFSARWTSEQHFAGGQYTFEVRADDGVRVKVDGNTVIDGWRHAWPSNHSATVQLAAGSHTLVVEYYENTGDAELKLTWNGQSAPAPPAQPTPTPTPSPTPSPDPSPTPSPTPTEPPQDNPDVSDLILYDNAIGSGFQDGTFAYSGRNDCEKRRVVTAPCAYTVSLLSHGGLNFMRTGGPLDTSGYAALEWYINPLRESISDISVLFTSANGNTIIKEIRLSQGYVTETLADGYVKVSVPVSTLNPSGQQIQTIQIKNATAGPLGYIAIDEVKLVAK